MTEDLKSDIARLERQEELLRFSRFDGDTAWRLGGILRDIAVERGAAIAIDISMRDRILFHCALEGTTTDNAEWIRRKRNTVLRLWNSSYLVGRRLAYAHRVQEEAHNLPLADFATHGGGFPILIDGLGCVGAVTVSGVPQRIDHAIVADGLARLLAVDLGDARLPE
ncbi:heme-degrading domain-containing protein [Rhizobium sp. ARZ01]|uniref:heme-degrading domain-containing protein n=1 Tax=Rhizobium sp. ARZ01 TaxID=2769313 RepID=UPI00177CDECE|nr:heme-degrading domain-containing protein [Rhizobium sp. ARZ01]MBD9373046.1 heme-degrading domain-containing protein [Rhizobium sp. ARZ01]